MDKYVLVLCKVYTQSKLCIILFYFNFLGKDLSGAFLEMSHKYKSEVILFQPFPAPHPMIVLNL